LRQPLQLTTFEATFTPLRPLFAIIICLFYCVAARPQITLAPAADTVLTVQDTLAQAGDTAVKIDSAVLITKDLAAPFFKRFDTALYNNHPFYQFNNPVQMFSAKRQWEGKEVFFYVLAGLFLFFALFKNAFGRYLKDLSKLFFRTTIKHRQLKEQLMQAPLPSLLLNILFFFTAALFLSMVLERFGLGTVFNFWLLLLYCAAGLVVIYLVKFLTLKFCGWLFGLVEATNSYIFIVFTTNKIVGILLLPLLVLLSFTAGPFNQAVFTVGLLLVGAVFVYRFFLSYVTIHRQLKLSFFHFVLYLLAFEIAPLLLINKLLVQFLS